MAEIFRIGDAMRSLLILLLLCGPSLAAQPAKRPARKQVLMIVKSTQQKAANEAATKVLGPYARNTFSVPYGKGAASFYISACHLTDQQEAAIREALDKLRGTKSQVLARGGEFTGKAKAELKRQNYKEKKAK